MREGQKRDFARHLRRTMTDAECKLWQQLRASQLAGYRFRRQHPIGPYVVDFACLKQCLVVEVDGGQHCDSGTDDSRDHYLRSQGFKVLRFWNNEVLQNLEGVCAMILQHLSAHPR